MPDMERVMRSLELHLARNAAEQAYRRGRHDGADAARMQVAIVAALAAFVAAVCAWCAA